MSKREAISIGGTTVEAGQRKTVDLNAGKLYTHAPFYVPVHVIHGKRPGPTIFVSAAIHGDELNGIEIIRRVLERRGLGNIRGTLLAVPIVNVLGVANHSRYLPDRRDLNRSFPGTASGSLAGRLAHLFMKNIVDRSDYGIDLHTGAIHRTNLPQIRARLDDPETLRLAEAFGAPLALDAQLRAGSLRDAATDKDVTVLLYEAGEALRFDELSIRVGVRGVLNVMRALEMLPRRKTRPIKPYIARSSLWVRAPSSGIFRARVALGDHVEKNDVIGVVSDPFGEGEMQIMAAVEGVIIGQASLPLVHEGEALFHIGQVSQPAAASARAEHISNLAIQDPLLSEEPLIDQ